MLLMEQRLELTILSQKQSVWSIAHDIPTISLASTNTQADLPVIKRGTSDCMKTSQVYNVYL